MRAATSGEPLVELDYAVAVEAASLQEAGAIDDAATVRLLVAAQVGPVRLIDNSGALARADDSLAAHDVTAQVRQLERIG
jgi:pantothenate synthetase